ncbi:hypothetical protein [Nocardioides sp. SLBN-35]|uniref:hypothetical protein n=1 Tax=Nocardioides sp. SLBN-35 TaxID=2768445 RepID=UPI001153CD52|nr:hypothetical protein [Nocardioides sp. SLBN-35]TQK72212.1 hypothetical protein FBY23_4022 [Nocardioides sp. SLBN-35]
MSTSMFVRRAVAAVAGGAVVAGGLMAVAPAPAAHAAAANVEAEVAATWLDSQVTGGLVGGDVGATIDYALSLLATGTDTPARLTTLREGVDDGVAAWANSDGRKAKAAYFFVAAGGDASNAGGLDLAQSTKNAVDDETGEIDGGSVYSQVWAVLALDALGSAEASKAASALTASQCAGGFWSFDCAFPDVDYTAYSVIALRAVDSTPSTTASVSKAVAYLKTKQAADGGLGDSGDKSDPYYTPDNSNTTGVAGWALGVAGETAAAAKSAAWIARHQVVALPGCGARGIDAEHGALAYSDASMKEAVDAGEIAPGPIAGQWQLASAQALAGLKYLAPAQPGLPTFVDAGTTATVPLQGARPGQQVCVTGLNAPQRLAAPASATFAVPAGTADHQVTLSYLGGSTPVTLKALDAKKLKVKVATKLKAKKKATIKVKGLASGESVTVKIGKKSATGVANAQGVAKVKIKVKKKGKAKVKVVGQFPDRKGKAKTRVV